MGPSFIGEGRILDPIRENVFPSLSWDRNGSSPSSPEPFVSRHARRALLTPYNQPRVTLSLLSGALQEQSAGHPLQDSLILARACPPFILPCSTLPSSPVLARACLGCLGRSNASRYVLATTLKRHRPIPGHSIAAVRALKSGPAGHGWREKGALTPASR